jgi:hypothetical protein
MSGSRLIVKRNVIIVSRNVQMPGTPICLLLKETVVYAFQK